MLEPPTILLLRKVCLTQGVVWQILRPPETAPSETVRGGARAKDVLCSTIRYKPMPFCQRRGTYQVHRVLCIIRCRNQWLYMWVQGVM